MNEQNKQFLQDNYSLKEQAEQGTLVLSEEQKREFYRIYQEEGATDLVNLYSQPALNEMVKVVFDTYEIEKVAGTLQLPDPEPSREEVKTAVKKSVKKK